MTDIRDYPVTIRPLSESDGGGYMALILDFPGCMGDGETEQQAIDDAREAAALYIEAYQERGQKVPEPQTDDLERYSGRLVLRLPKALHRSLSQDAERNGVSLNTWLVTLLSEQRVRHEIADQAPSGNGAQGPLSAVR